jgi:DNA-directed RNA polymerase II subunit RPB9
MVNTFSLILLKYLLMSSSSNMLYPKEDPDTHRLQFACRTCQYSEEAASSCVFRNVLNNAVGETAGVTQDVGSDPTVGISDSWIPLAVPPYTESRSVRR